MIKVSNLYYSYKLPGDAAAPALEDINIEIQKGEFVAIIGHNGSGKSTLVRHFNGLLLPNKGDVIINGINTKEKDKIWDIRQTVGMIFQNPDNQIVGTIVEEDVAFGPENLQMPPDVIRERVNACLDAVGLKKYRKFPPHLLSGGQKQKVAIASVLAMRSEYIILDESTTMLDPKGRREVLDSVKKLKEQEGLTIILITHFMEEAALADRVIVMNKGKIFIDAAPREVFSQPARMREASLGVPLITELADGLRREGIGLPEGIISVNEFVREYKSAYSVQRGAYR